MVAPPAVVLRCARVVTAPMRCEVALGPPRAINAVEQEWPQARAPIFPPSSKSCSSALASSASTSRGSSLRARSSALLRPPNQRSTSRKIQGTKRKYRARRCTVLIPGNGASANASRSAPTPSSSRVSERPSSSTTWQRAPPLGVGEGQPGQRGQGVRKVRDGASGQRKGALRDRHQGSPLTTLTEPRGSRVVPSPAQLAIRSTARPQEPRPCGRRTAGCRHRCAARRRS